MLTCRAFINGRAKHVFAVVITGKGIKNPNKYYKSKNNSLISNGK